MFANLDINNQIARSCDQLGHIDTRKNANFAWLLALYFCPLVLGHPVQIQILFGIWKIIRILFVGNIRIIGLNYSNTNEGILG